MIRLLGCTSWFCVFDELTGHDVRFLTLRLICSTYAAKYAISLITIIINCSYLTAGRIINFHSRFTTEMTVKSILELDLRIDTCTAYKVFVFENIFCVLNKEINT